MVGCRGLVVCSLWWLCCHRSSCNTNRCAGLFRVALFIHKHSRCYGYTNKQADKQIEHVSSPVLALHLAFAESLCVCMYVCSCLTPFWSWFGLTCTVEPRYNGHLRVKILAAVHIIIERWLIYRGNIHM